MRFPGRQFWTTQLEVLRSKNVWEWLDLLGVPLALVAVGVIFNMAQAGRDDRRDDDRAREATLQSYLTEMSDLMLDGGLLGSRPGEDVRVVARTLTLTAIRRLDGKRKGLVVRFLAEADLVRACDPRVSLALADLRHADLSSAIMRRADLKYAQLQGANLLGADLRGADLTYADLRDANLKAAHLQKAYLAGADLSDAVLPPPALMKGAVRGPGPRTAFLEPQCRGVPRAR